MKFIDTVSLTMISGHGGPGCVSFRKESQVPRGGPDGGDGGRGGHIILKVNPQLSSLSPLSYKKKFKAQDGFPGSSCKSSGKDGKNLIIEVPAGTVVKNAEGILIADLGVEKEVILLKGGRGGKGNCFYKSSVHQAPEIAQKGEKEKIFDVCLELKSIADVGLVGFPNAGKSTLLSKISSAHPKVADYPFTTLIPHLGVVRVDEKKSFVVADIPGLIEGAHKGVGLGIQFLRHIERTQVFVHLVDSKPFNEESAIDNYKKIIDELKGYDEINKDQQDYEPLSERPQILVLNKADMVDPEEIKELCKEFEENFKISPIVISALTGKQVRPLIFKIHETLEALKGSE